MVVIFGINTSSDISKLLYEISRAVRRVKFETILKYHEFIFGGAYLRREVLRFTIDWASLIVGSKLTVFALFYFVSEGNFPSASPRGAYIWRGDLTGFFLGYWFGGLIFGILRKETVLLLVYPHYPLLPCQASFAEPGSLTVFFQRDG